MNRRAFSLTEVVAVLAIISVLALVTYPIMTAAVKSGRITRSMSNMRQINTALHLYTQAQNKDSADLSAYPSFIEFDLQQFGITEDMWNSGGVSIDGRPTTYAYLIGGLVDNFGTPEWREARWQEHLRRTGGNPLILIDGNQEKNHQVSDAFFPSLAFAIYSDGHVLKKQLSGDPYRFEPWENQ